MIQRESNITIADNSGAKVGKLIGAPGYSKIKFIGLGSTVKIAVQKLYQIVGLRSMMS